MKVLLALIVLLALLGTAYFTAERMAVPPSPPLADPPATARLRLVRDTSDVDPLVHDTGVRHAWVLKGDPTSTVGPEALRTRLRLVAAVDATQLEDEKLRQETLARGGTTELRLQSRLRTGARITITDHTVDDGSRVPPHQLELAIEAGTSVRSSVLLLPRPFGGGDWAQIQDSIELAPRTPVTIAMYRNLPVTIEWLGSDPATD